MTDQTHDDLVLEDRVCVREFFQKLESLGLVRRAVKISNKDVFNDLLSYLQTFDWIAALVSCCAVMLGSYAWSKLFIRRMILDQIEQAFSCVWSKSVASGVLLPAFSLNDVKLVLKDMFDELTENGWVFKQCRQIHFVLDQEPVQMLQANLPWYIVVQISEWLEEGLNDAKVDDFDSFGLFKAHFDLSNNRFCYPASVQDCVHKSLLLGEHNVDVVKSASCCVQHDHVQIEVAFARSVILASSALQVWDLRNDTRFHWLELTEMPERFSLVWAFICIG